MLLLIRSMGLDLSLFSIAELQSLLADLERTLRLVRATVASLPQHEIPIARLIHIAELEEKQTAYRQEIAKRQSGDSDSLPQPTITRIRAVDERHQETSARVAPQPPWLELALTLDPTGLRIRARGSREELTPLYHLPAAGIAATLSNFAASTQKAAKYRRPLGDVLAVAHEIYAAVITGAIADLCGRLLEAGDGEPLLLRLVLDGVDLQSIPWEALCEPGSAMTFWASSARVLPARSVITNTPWTPRDIYGAVKVLAIAPTDESTLPVLEFALRKRIDTGAVVWLKPIVGRAATLRHIHYRIQDESPHILHFLGHGAVISGNPCVRLADDSDGEEQWLPVELLAQTLEPLFRTTLRLVVLEACSGAQSGVFASAAEILARGGADAVVAHLWTVKADVARACSQQFYQSMVAHGPSRGNVARSLNDARRVVLADFGGSAEAFSPVLYLRAPQSSLFYFR